MRYTVALLSAGLLNACCSDNVLESQSLPQQPQLIQLEKSAPNPAPVATHNSAQLFAEYQQLFTQTHIDPLTEYIERYEQDSVHQQAIIKVKAERERRCEQAQQQATDLAKNAENLQTLTARYQRSCPQLIATFASQITPTTPTTAVTTPIATESAPIATPTPIVDKKSSTVETTPAQLLATKTETNTNTIITNPPAISETSEKDTITPNPNHEVASPPVIKETCEALYNASRFQDVINTCQSQADAGDKQAQFYLGASYLKTEKTEVAFNWLEKAAKGGHVEAQYQIGQLFYIGKGVKQDHDKALEWFKSAAQQGHPQAQFMLENI
ncbi:Sel1 repeat protein [Beggiatoa alba B18LD]|uniref:Sel1 repeat protein n=1 Tax=Beggiatoa alba B18LD TaxID=395493 RepID=I3CFX2_9GAMM|nr:tetratricopeptide repeat protein [Beggiatoa alba]EIJ42515.1 Sel1 repeat protein [Beggiatoa alba B18LD]